MTEIKDFTRPRTRILFRIDDDVFEASSALPAETLYEFSLRFTDLERSEDRMKSLIEVLELVLLPESCAVFRARLKDLGNPIEVEQLNDVLVWLLERYGARPTRPSSNLSAGPPGLASGTSSTDGAPAAASISELSLPTVS